MRQNRRAKLIILCGLPGSGKTTLAKALESDLPSVRLCPDEWLEAIQIDHYDSSARERVEELQWSLAQRLLSLGNIVVIEWGTWGRSERDRLRLGARALGAEVELRFLDGTADALFARVCARNREDPPLTRQTFEEWASIFEPPTKEETALFD